LVAKRQLTVFGRKFDDELACRRFRGVDLAERPHHAPPQQPQRHCATLTYRFRRKPGYAGPRLALLVRGSARPIRVALAVTSRVSRPLQGRTYGLAGIDLLRGKVHFLVRDRHRSREFIEFLKLLDAAYPTHTAIKLILDNHSAHISKETKAWLADQP